MPRSGRAQSTPPAFNISSVMLNPNCGAPRRKIQSESPQRGQGLALRLIIIVTSTGWAKEYSVWSILNRAGKPKREIPV